MDKSGGYGKAECGTWLGYLILYSVSARYGDHVLRNLECVLLRMALCMS